MASTEISPRVSKPRKSTRMTLTTLAPPPPGRLLARKKSAMVAAGGRVSTVQVSKPVVVPRVSASMRSRSRRRGVDSTGVRCGRKNRASSRRMMVTTSMASWVRARSGAEKRTKASAHISPTTLRGMRARKRRRCQRTVSTAPVIMASPPNRVRPSSGTGGGPRGGQRPRTSGTAMAAAAAQNSSASDRCREPLAVAAVQRRAAPKAPSTNCENRLCASTPGKSWACRAKTWWRTAYRLMPRIRAVALMASGRLNPCHTARSKAGRGEPSTLAAASLRKGATVRPGKMPTIRQWATRITSGSRISRGASWGGYRGRLTGSPLKNTSWMKRAE